MPCTQAGCYHHSVELVTGVDMLYMKWRASLKSKLQSPQGPQQLAHSQAPPETGEQQCSTVHAFLICIERAIDMARAACSSQSSSSCSMPSTAFGQWAKTLSQTFTPVMKCFTHVKYSTKGARSRGQ